MLRSCSRIVLQSAPDAHESQRYGNEVFLSQIDESDNVTPVCAIKSSARSNFDGGTCECMSNTFLMVITRLLDTDICVEFSARKQQSYVERKNAMKVESVIAEKKIKHNKWRLTTALKLSYI